MADNLVMPNGTPSVENFQNWAQSQFGRQANPMELQQIGSRVGAPSGPNGQYSSDQYQQAQNYSRELATAQGWHDPNGGGNSAPPPQQQAPPPPQQSHQISGVPMTYQAGSYTSQYQATPYTPNYQPTQYNQQYNPYQFSQFVPQNVDTQGRDSLLQGMLANPHSLNQQWQDQTNETAKESANAYAKQLQQQASQGTANRGLSGLGGAQRQNTMDIQQALMSQLLSGQRGTATHAAEQNRADELNAMQAANQTYTADADRARQNYAAQLAGQSAQAGEGQYASDFGLKQFMANEANKQFGANLGLQGASLNEQNKQAQNQQALQAFAANEAAKQGASASSLNEGQLDFNTADAARQRSLQEFLGVVGAGLEQNRFREDQRQFNQSYGLDAQRLGMTQDQFNRTFGENQRQFNLGYNQNDRQFNDTLGLNWANSQNGQVNNILGFLQQFYGG